MKLHKSVRALTAAALLALVATGISAGAADAKPRPGTSGTYCAIPGAMADPPSENDWEFAFPGEWVGVIDNQGNHRILECQPDGTWKVVLREAPTHVGIHVPLQPIISR